ncbi:BadF/BadG/BcrA/BcrD ATPase family protein [Streptomyces sp. 11x1]|uniref:BadF/BadG/BcrA/BcrD ATPase family protein n=1 Tax=Streptomyces sp. 11x1 TaxID=3038642 RepID=UPI00292E5FA4|nr:BadF/BadG/BcrA/BcrD ATPase family protein [Streptomyces sp. 11x1]WNZ13375.1 BadF/BadG/BcrA/BcrD ATPase family protein [Streptomyces sp. 11x1]
MARAAGTARAADAAAAAGPAPTAHGSPGAAAPTPTSTDHSAPPPATPAPVYVVGIDAGGTRTRAVLAELGGGAVIGEGAAGPGNSLTVPGPLLADHLVEAVARAVPEALRGRVVAVAGGFAGAGHQGQGADEPGRLRARAALSAALARLGVTAASVGVHSDIETTFAAAPGHPADGLVLVAGTGAVAARMKGRVPTATSGGDGWLLGDDGGGFWIGRAAVRAALRAADGRGRPTALVLALGRDLGLPAEVLPPEDYGASGAAVWSAEQRTAYRARLLPTVMDRAPVRLADHAPVVVRTAEEKDAVAVGILQEAARRLVDTVAALAPRPGEPLVATGGLLAPDGPLLPPLTERLAPLGLTVTPVADGSPGAVALARLAHGRSD